MSRAQRAVVVTAFVVALLPFVSPSEARAQSYAVTVWNQLNAQYNRVNDDGYTSRNYIIGRLKNSDTETWNLYLAPGEYQITGVCDGDCKDIDLALQDANKRDLVSDTSADDVPVLSYRVRTAGTFSIKVTMYSCSQDPCYFGLGVFFK